MANVGLPITYDGPVVTAPRASLLTSAEVVKHPDDRFAGGIDIQYETCSDDHIGIWEYCVDDPDEKPVGPYGTNATFAPFTITAGITCSTYSNYDASTFKLKAKRKLEANFSKALETELWSGTTLSNDHIASADATALTTGAEVSPEIGLAALEQALGGRGTIHMSPLILGRILALADDMLIREIDAQTGDIKYYTYMGNPIVAGYGYPGTSNSGGAPDADAEWIYSTAPVVVHVGPITYPAETIVQGLDRTKNDVTFYAEQTGIATFDSSCGHYAAKVSRGYTKI